MPIACAPKRYGTVTTERSAISSTPSSWPIFTLGRFGVHRVGDQIVERLLLFDDAQNRAQLAQVLELGLVEQVLRAGRGDRRLFASSARCAAPCTTASRNSSATPALARRGAISLVA